MTKQQFLDLLIKTSIEGGFPSINFSGKRCLYRDGRGRKCAVGLLIPDELYNSKMEEAGTSCYLFKVYPHLEKIIPDGLTQDDIRIIQTAHDVVAVNPIRWNHDLFVTKLVDSGIFSDCTFPSPA